MENRIIFCPSCGKKAMIEIQDEPMEKHIECPGCKCKFRLAFNQDLHIEDIQKRHILAEDYP